MGGHTIIEITTLTTGNLELCAIWADGITISTCSHIWLFIVIFIISFFYSAAGPKRQNAIPQPAQILFR